MIFVTVGTNEAPFDRLLRAVEGLPPTEGIIVQHGASDIRPVRARCFDYLPFETILEYVRTARAVVTHAGVGSIMVALGQGKHPIVVPRLHRFGEAVDDHQRGFALRLQRTGLVTLVEDPDALADALGGTAAASAAAPPLSQPLAEELRTYLGTLLRHPRRAA